MSDLAELLHFLGKQKIPTRLAIELLIEYEKTLASKIKRREKAVVKPRETR